MLNASINHQESPAVLINFLNTFCENIPDLGSFLLFAISVRCLPATTRRLFEQGNNVDFPTVDSLLYFTKDRVEVLDPLWFTPQLILKLSSSLINLIR